MSGFPTILYKKSDGVAYVTLNRPDMINAFNMQMRDDLWELLAAIEDDPEVRAMVLSGAGDRGFCAGADLREFGTAPSVTQARASRWARDVFGRLARLPKGTIAALHGHVVGSGVELAALCDIRVASEDAVFHMPETAYGLIPAAGGTQTLPRLMGTASASALLLAGERLNAEAALRSGLVGRVVPRERLTDEAVGTARAIADLSLHAVAGLKKAAWLGVREPLGQGIQAEGRIARRVAAEGRP